MKEEDGLIYRLERLAESIERSADGVLATSTLGKPMVALDDSERYVSLAITKKSARNLLCLATAAMSIMVIVGLIAMSHDRNGGMNATSAATYEALKWAIVSPTGDPRSATSPSAFRLDPPEASVIPKQTEASVRQYLQLDADSHVYFASFLGAPSSLPPGVEGGSQSAWLVVKNTELMNRCLECFPSSVPSIGWKIYLDDVPFSGTVLTAGVAPSLGPFTSITTGKSS